MKNRTLSSIITLVVALSTAVNPVFASETTGTINTGVGNNEANGVVIAAPTPSPSAGTYYATKSVTLAATGASTIRYTTDGTTPSCAPVGTLYSSAISVASTTTIKSISCYANSVASSVASSLYTIGTPSAPSVSPAAGTFSSTQSVTLTASNASTIRYTTDGNTPSCAPAGTLYSSAISVASTTTVKAIACYPDTTPSSVTSATYTIETGGAVINPGGGGGGGGGGGSSTTTTTTTTTDTPKTDTPVSLEFKDAKTHWSKDFAEKLRTKCGITGYKDAKGVPLGIFKPDNSITRAELMKMIVDCKFKTVDVPTVNPFNDVPKGEWYAPAIATAKKLGWTNGYNNGTLFKPMQPITRAEAMKLILLSQFADTDVVKDAESMKLFKDVKEDWYTKYITFAVMKGFVSGYKDGSGKLTGFFGTFNNITRGETAKIIVNVQGL